MENQIKDLESRIVELEKFISNQLYQSTIDRDWQKGLENISDKTLWATVTLDVSDTAIGSSTNTTVNVPGAQKGDPVLIGFPSSAIVGIGSWLAYVSADGVVTIRFSNPDPGSTLNPGSGTFNIAVLKRK